MLQLDRIAKGRENSLVNYGSGDDFWTKVDAAGDEVYENRVKGTEMTALDADLADGSNWSTTSMRQWFLLHERYCISDLGYAAASGAPALNAYLAAVAAMRVPYYAAESLYDALGLHIPATKVFPKGTLVADTEAPGAAGMHSFGILTGPSTWAAGDGALPATCGPAAVLTVGMASNQTVGATFRCTNYVAATTKDLALVLAGATQYTQTLLGAVAPGSGESAGASLIRVSSTSTFTAGEWVLIFEGSTQEVALVSSLGTGPTKLVLTTPLINNFTTGATVVPLFRSAAYQSGGSGTGAVNVYAMPDRVIAL